MRGISSEYDKLIESIRSGFSVPPGDMVLPSPLGPIKVEDLPFLEGWRYTRDTSGFPGAEPALAIAGPIVTLVDFTDEKGWVLSFDAVFRSPFGQLNFRADDWRFSVTPYLVNMMGRVFPNPIAVYNSVYNPFTPLGPMYSVVFAPAYAQSYSRQVGITMSLPADSPIDPTNVFFASVDRVWLQDEKRFLRSVKKHILSQMTGQKIERYP